MEIILSDAAVKWFKEEVGIKEGDKVKFYTQIYGTSPVQPGFSLGFIKDNTPLNVAVSKTVGNIEFYIEQDDLWFFNNHDLQLDYNEKYDEIQYNYIAPEKK